VTDETTPADTHAAEPTPDPVAVDSTVAPEPGLAAPPTADHPVAAPAEKPDEQTSADASTAEASSGEQPAGEQASGEEPTAEQPAGEQASGEEPTAEQPAGEQASGEQPSGEQPATPSAPSPAAGARPAPPKPSVPKPGPAPSPAALRAVAHPPAHVPATAPPGPPAETFGRVDESGTVFVRTAEGEREVGSYPGASHEEALHYFARKYDELWASADLLHQRLVTTDLGSRDAQDGLTKLREHIAEAKVVGDLEALEAKVAEIEQAVKARKEIEAAERSRAREAARLEREALVIEAEGIAAQPENKIQWKTSGARMRALLDEWKQHQRSGARLDRETESALWQRFSHARNSFDKARRVHFAQLESTQSEAKSAKEALVAEAEALSSSTDWGATAGAYKRLMDRWRKAGRASRADDDALWERFKAAQDAFFAAKDQVAAAEDEEFRGNLAVKEGLLKEAQGILPVTDIDAAKAALRSIQEKWDAAGKVPRADVDRMEKALRRIESAVREADEKRWAQTNPEVAARAQSMVDQLEASVASLRDDLATAEASGNQAKVADARAKLEAQEQWLAQARGNLDEFSG
jgi:uncharacterized protein DUF349